MSANSKFPAPARLAPVVGKRQFDALPRTPLKEAQQPTRIDRYRREPWRGVGRFFITHKNHY